MSRCRIFQSKTGYEVKSRHHCRKCNSLCCPKLSQIIWISSEFKFWEPRCKTTMQFVLLLYVPFFLPSFPEQFFILNFYFIPNFCIRPTNTDMDRKPLEFWGSALRYVLAASCHILPVTVVRASAVLKLMLLWSRRTFILKQQNWVQEKVGHLLCKNRNSSGGWEE